MCFEGRGGRAFPFSPAAAVAFFSLSSCFLSRTGCVHGPRAPGCTPWTFRHPRTRRPPSREPRNTCRRARTGSSAPSPGRRSPGPRVWPWSSSRGRERLWTRRQRRQHCCRSQLRQRAPRRCRDEHALSVWWPLEKWLESINQFFVLESRGGSGGVKRNCGLSYFSRRSL